MSVLPQELLDSIIDHVSDDFETLKSCSLVSRELTLASHRKLFRHLFIHLRGSEVSINSYFSELCSRPQHQLSLIQSLTIPLTGSRWRYDRKLFLRTLQLLVNLTRVEILCASEDGLTVMDEESGISPQDLVRECCRPSVIRLSLYGSNAFPSDALHQCTSLTHLALTHIALLPTSYEVPSTTRIPLQCLYIGTPMSVGIPAGSIVVHRFFEHSSCPWNIHQLRTLGFRAAFMEDYEVLIKLMEDHPLLHVTSFAVEVPLEFITPEDHQLINLSLLPRLTCLTFSIEENSPSQQSFIPWMISQLHEIPALNKLYEFYIRITLRDYATMISVREQEWSRLDDCLAEDVFKNLQYVSLKVYLQYWISNTQRIDNEEVVKAFKDVFPKTAERKVLDVDVSTTRWYFLDENFPTLSF